MKKFLRMLIQAIGAGASLHICDRPRIIGSAGPSSAECNLYQAANPRTFRLGEPLALQATQVPNANYLTAVVVAILFIVPSHGVDFGNFCRPEFP